MLRRRLHLGCRCFRRCSREPDERFKLIKYNAGGEKHTQLFDLRDDADELHNLADDARLASERLRLEGMPGARLKRVRRSDRLERGKCETIILWRRPGLICGCPFGARCIAS